MGALSVDNSLARRYAGRNRKAPPHRWKREGGRRRSAAIGSDRGGGMTTTIFVCDTCRYSAEHRTGPGEKTGGEMLAERIEQLASAAPGIEVRRQSCLMGCEGFCNTAVTAPGKLTYVLGRFAPTDASAEAVVDYARLHAASATGQVPFRQWPPGVKGHFVARIPAVGPAIGPVAGPA
jgi:predicted metal-binding protein